jgi:DNA polymerase
MPVHLQQLAVPRFDHSSCHCEACSLKEQRDRTYCAAQVPAFFNGLMIIGEGPGEVEARLKVPFVGRAGELLDLTLQAAGIDRAQCYVTNSTSCLPPPRARDGKTGKEITFEQAHPYAVPACLPRLRAEIEAVQPRVILALGNQALLGLTGAWREKKVREPRFKKVSV